MTGAKNDDYFTDEARYYFVYDGTNGISLSFFGDDDLFIFINGVLVHSLQHRLHHSPGYGVLGRFCPGFHVKMGATGFVATRRRPEHGQESPDGLPAPPAAAE